MKTNRAYARAYVTPKAEKACRAGHPWVYDAEIERIVAPGERDDELRLRPREPFAGIEERGVANGSLIDVLTRKGGYLGTGILSLNSKIRIRLVSTNANDAFDAAFWERKVRWAWEHRKTVMGSDASCCRLLFSEADGFCGLVVDRFEDVLVTQTLAFGMERLKPVVFPALVKVLAEDGVRIRGIYERNDVGARELEGLPQTCGWYPLATTHDGPIETPTEKGCATSGPRTDVSRETLGQRSCSGTELRTDVSRETFLEGATDAGAGAGGTSMGTTDAGAARGAGGTGRSLMPSLDEVPAPIAADAPEAAAFGPATVLITENGVRYLVDFEHGQKTGFFLDQKYNRRAVGALAGGRHVLDCFTHTGSFALNAALGGAAHVHAVDVSDVAIDAARTNARLNGPDAEARLSFEVANVFDVLPQIEAAHGRDGQGGRYDFIVLDPPAFTKSRRTVEAASRGYHEINQRAMKILPRGGYLATCSCSHFMDAGRFRGMLASAAQGAGVQLRQIEERQQAPDHPIVWGVPETDYLKFFLFQVV